MGQLLFELFNLDCSETPAKEFRCGNGSVEQRLRAYSAPMSSIKHAYTYSISAQEKLLGYYMISFKRILLRDCPEKISDFYGDLDYCTSIHVEFIAISSKYQKRGIGTVVLREIIERVRRLSVHFPVRLITLDAVTEHEEWYRKNGFAILSERSAGQSTVLMYLDCISQEEMERIEQSIDE